MRTACTHSLKLHHSRAQPRDCRGNRLSHACLVTVGLAPPPASLDAWVPKDKYDIYFIGFQESGWTSGAKIPQTQILSYMWDTRTGPPHNHSMFAVDAECCPTARPDRGAGGAVWWTAKASRTWLRAIRSAKVHCPSYRFLKWWMTKQGVREPAACGKCAMCCSCAPSTHPAYQTSR